MASGQSLQMNVSKKADREFRFDLKKTDRKRWASLDADVQQEFYRKQRADKPSKLNEPDEPNDDSMKAGDIADTTSL